jgi:hypothetical protein
MSPSGIRAYIRRKPGMRDVEKIRPKIRKTESKKVSHLTRSSPHGGFVAENANVARAERQSHQEVRRDEQPGQ